MNRALKRLFDILLSFIGIILFSPLWLLIVLAVKIEDGGEIFCTQARLGKDCRLFKALKFRSMIPQAEAGLGPVQAKENDSRITKIGRALRATAMDELPQLVNILRGQMSFVGPRSLRPQEKEVQDNTVRSALDYPAFKLRCAVRPGLTGAAQIFAPRDLPREEKFKYDIWYIKNQSLPLDIRLIILSFLVTFLAKWEARSPKFTGLASALKNKLREDIRRY